LIDYIAMDIKGPLDKYDKVVGIKVNKGNIKKSIKLIMQSNIPYEFRSTILPELHKKDDLKKMAQMIKGAEKYYLQKFMPGDKLIDKTFSELRAYSDKEMEEMAKICAEYVVMCKFRGA